MGFNGSVVRVCVIDIGVDVNHPDVAGKMWTANGSILEVGGKCRKHDFNCSIRCQWAI